MLNMKMDSKVFVIAAALCVVVHLNGIVPVEGWTIVPATNSTHGIIPFILIVLRIIALNYTTSMAYSNQCNVSTIIIFARMQYSNIRSHKLQIWGYLHR